MNAIIDFLTDSGISFSQCEPMKLHTTFRIGGDASVFINAKSVSEVSQTVKLCRKNGVPLFTVGNGSNLLVDDGGIDGVVMKLSQGMDFIRLLDETTVEAGAGASLAAVCKFALANSLSGIEFAYGIPGTVGGAAYMNAGAYGGEMRDITVSCRHVDLDGNGGELYAGSLNFGYRKSAYTENGFIITSVIMKLKKGDPDEIKAKMDDLLGRRIDKQPLEFPSAGSVFRRPEGYFAGALIEQSGLKGRTVGGAEVSKKHAGFIVNAGGATCADVKKLIQICQQTVFEKFGVQLETEIKFI